jgi:serine phosphatase RsbU (regulator of sigma subunit)
MLCIITYTVTQNTLHSTLPLTLSNGSGVAFEEQIIDQLPALIRSGKIEPGTPLPPARQLASDLLVSPGTVRRAYARLEAEGLVVQRPGDRPFVVRDAEEVLRQRTLDRSRSELARAIANIRHLAPDGREELEVEADHLRQAIELDQAREMQRSLLPQAPPATPGFDVAVSMSTASEVGGDYYDFFPQPAGALRAVIGDATGHGLAAGIMAAMTKSCLTAITAESPSRMMQKANDVLQVVRRKRVMMALSVLDVQDDYATICSAGMPPVFVLRQQTGEVEEVGLASLPLGSALAESFPCRRIDIDPGDAIIALSDGLPELRNPQGEALGAAPIRACLAANVTASAAELVAALTSLAATWANDRAPEDDLTFLVIRRHINGHNDGSS